MIDIINILDTYIDNMNIQQIAYVVAVADLKNFSLAAKRCSITQSTLSTMIAKFEDEIGIRIFDRTTKPVTINMEGEVIINQMRLIQKELDIFNEVTATIRDETIGALTIGIIPTVAPFLLPRILPGFVRKFPKINFTVVEMTTSKIIESLNNRNMDIGIVSIPLRQNQILETPLYNEHFVLYDEKLKSSGKVKISSINPNRFWLLAEGHCMRTQVQRICDMDKFKRPSQNNLEYRSGSIDTLMKLVRSNQGSTLLPYLATRDLPQELTSKIAEFDTPVPARSIGLAVHRHFMKQKILRALKKDIQEKIRPILPQKVSTQFIDPL